MQVQFNSSDILKWSWERTKKHLGFLIAITIIMGILNSIPSVFSRIATEYEVWGAQIVINFASAILSALISIIMIRVALDVVDKDKGSFDGIFDDLNMFGWVLLANLMVFVIVALGLVFFVIPGIAAAVLLMFVIYSIVDKKMNAVEAITYSFELVKENFFPVLLFSLMLLGINLLGAIALCIGLLVTMPLSAVATAKLYRILDDANNGGSQQFYYQPSSPSPNYTAAPPQNESANSTNAVPSVPSTSQPSSGIPVKPTPPPPNAPSDNNRFTYTKEEFTYNETNETSGEENKE